LPQPLGCVYSSAEQSSKSQSMTLVWVPLMAVSVVFIGVTFCHRLQDRNR